MLCKFRMQSNALNIETGRYRSVDRNLRLCTLCSRNEVEDEFHFILVCPVYNDIRRRYIKPYYLRRTCVFKLVQLFSARSTKTLTNLAKYLYYASAKRLDLLQSQT